MNGPTPQFVVTIDVEPDGQWDSASSGQLGNLARLPRLHQALREAGARPTYLVTYSVCTEKAAAAWLAKVRQADQCEVGAHLHPWDTPPLTESDAADGPKPYPTELGGELLRRKLASLTDLIGDRVGIRSRSYRAGRWGLDGDGLRALEELGYQVDTSVTPLVCWQRQRGRSQGSRGPCFKSASPAPYRPAYQDVCRAGTSSVLEVPVSIGFLRPVGPRLRRWYERTSDISLALRLLRASGLLRPAWLRPSFSSAERMVAVGERLLAAGAPVLNMAFHSSEVLPGASPYVSTEAGAEAFLERIRRAVRHFLEVRGMEPATLSEVRRPPRGEGGGG